MTSTKSTKGNQRKGFQDSIGIEEFRGKYRLNLARKHSRAYYGTDQKRISTGLTICQENYGAIEKMAWDIHYDILRNDFDTTLAKYGLAESPKLTVIEAIKPKQLSLLEIYDMYVDSRKGSIAETMLELRMKKAYRQPIIKAINAVGEDALVIRNWLVENYNKRTTKECLRYLSKAHQLAIKHKYIIDNPFEGMAEDIKVEKNQIKPTANTEDDDEDNDTKAFTIDEMNAIIEAFESSHYRRHLTPIIKFLFWTGCRTGEAVALKWRDIKWDKESITIRQTYSHEIKKFKPTKTGVIRFFPLPKDGQLWNLLKSIPERGLNDVVFMSKKGGIINAMKLHETWKGRNSSNCPGVIRQLIEQGKVSQYLKLYATRHTFISHQVNIHKIPITTVAQWVGNGAMVSNNNYLDRDKMTVPGYSITPLEATESTNSKPNSDESNQQMADFVAGLTPEQREQFKALLSNQ